MRILRWLTVVVLVAWVGAVLTTAAFSAPASPQGQGKGKGGGGNGGDDAVFGVEMFFHDMPDLDNDGTVDAVNLRSDGMERTASGGLVIASDTDVRYADKRLLLGDPYVSTTGNESGLDFDDPNGASADDPANERTFTLVFDDDGCVCQTLSLTVANGQCSFTADFSDPLRNPRIASDKVFKGKKAGISIKFKLSVVNGNQWQVDSVRSNLPVMAAGDQRTLTSTNQEFELNRVGGGQFSPATLCTDLTLPFQITFGRVEITS